MKLYIQVGRSTKVLGNVKVPPPLNFTFNRLGQQRYLGNIKIDIQLLMMMMVMMMMVMMMMMMMRCPSSLQFGSKPRHLPHIYIYIYIYLSIYLSIYRKVQFLLYADASWIGECCPGWLYLPCPSHQKRVL